MRTGESHQSLACRYLLLNESYMRNFVLLTGALLLAPALHAQSTTGAQTRVPSVADNAIVRALDFPLIMQRARAAGAPDSTLTKVLEAMRSRGLPAHDAAAALETEVEIVEQGGNRDNFGQFVKSQVESGLRGQDLAAAIRAERARRGMGPDRAEREDKEKKEKKDKGEPGNRPEDDDDRDDNRGDNRGGRSEDGNARAGRRPDGVGAPPVTGRPAGSARPGTDSTRGKSAPGSVRRP